jgi:SAM-dependent methyltransferase
VSKVARRPFYSEYAWAFDLLIDRPVRKECSAIASWLVDRRVSPGAKLLDAGCGTGRYAIELARRGYVVDGIDLSPELIDVARQSAGSENNSLWFDVCDITALPREQYAGILCRGVLNDVLEDAQREAIVEKFASLLQPDGVLILDVREWQASAVRKACEPLFRKRVSTERGELTFTSVTTLDAANRQLLISESHVLAKEGAERKSDYQFVMRCWERDELSAILRRHGFGNVQYFGAYDAAVDAGATDRLVVVAQRSRQEV